VSLFLLAFIFLTHFTVVDAPLVACPSEHALGLPMGHWEYLIIVLVVLTWKQLLLSLRYHMN
jgi:hypothetical protein